ncbi:MAG: hypothetical protein ACK6AD_13445 [Cyanobacteriota bacterium]
MALHLILPEGTSPEDEAAFRRAVSWLSCVTGTDRRVPLLTTNDEHEGNPCEPPADCT